jgi:hypothetical protein
MFKTFLLCQSGNARSINVKDFLIAKNVNPSKKKAPKDANK